MKAPVDISFGHGLGHQCGVGFKETAQCLCKEPIKVSRPSLVDKRERTGGEFSGEFCFDDNRGNEWTLALEAVEKKRILD